MSYFRQLFTHTNEIILKYYPETQREEVKKGMIRAAKSIIKKEKTLNSYLTLKQVRSENIGTNEVEYGMNTVCRNLNSREKFRCKMKIMKNKMKDALNEFRKARKDNWDAWKEVKKNLDIDPV